MAMNPDFVMVPPTPMSRNPNPINPTDVVARSMYIVRSVTDLNIHNDSICHRSHCNQHCQKYRAFPFHTVTLYRIKTNAGRLLFLFHGIDLVSVNVEHELIEKGPLLTRNAPPAFTGTTVNIVA